MTRRVSRMLLLLLAIACIAATAMPDLRAAGLPASDPRAATPDQGGVTNGAYVNAYFGIRYPLPPGWGAGPAPPRPSAGGYYVLSTPTPPHDAKATILIAAQDTFFSVPPIADAGNMPRELARSVSAGKNEPIASRAATIAGRQFVRIDLPGVPLSRIVYATDIRCHIVIFTFAGVEPGRLAQLSGSLGHLSFAQERSVPHCINGYATARTLRHRVEPVQVKPQYARVPVRIDIDTGGRVEHIHVLRATAAQRQSIEDALVQWRFEPYRLGGTVDEVETGLIFEFRPVGKSG